MSTTKVTYLSPQNFSKRFTTLFKNDEYSDCEIILKKSKKVIPGHKLILCSSSTFFENHFEKNDKFVFEEEDEDGFMKLLEFLYTGAYDYSKEDNVINFILKTNTYGVKQISEFKIPSRKLLRVIINHIEADKSKMKEFDQLLRYVDFGVFEKEELLLIFKRVPWMTDSLHFLKSILQKDVDELYKKDEEDEAEEKREFENIFKSENEQEDSSSVCMKWDKNYMSPNAVLSNGGKVVVYNGQAWQGSGLGVKGHQYTVKVHTNSTNSMIGFSTRSFNKNASNYGSCGYFMYFSGLTLYGGGTYRKSGNAYGNTNGQYRNVNVNDTVGAKYDKRKGTITFYLNGVSLGVAYTDVKEKELYPCCDFYTSGSKLEFIRGKYKNK